MTVADLIKRLQAVENQQAVVSVQSTLAATPGALATVTATGASQTFEPDAPAAEFGANGAAPSPGTVLLSQ